MKAGLLLNLAQLLPQSRANGPGLRMVLWVQGCPFRCPNCQNPDYLEFKLNQVVTVDRVWQIFKQTPGLEGISFSGGEPFAQAVALSEIARRVRDSGKTVVSWTGYTLEELQTRKIKGATDLLSCVDLLIDGLFMEKQAGYYPLRGSANQRLHFLTGNITEAELINIPRQEWVMTREKLTYTGFPLSKGGD